jgi:hypothetical protein
MEPRAESPGFSFWNTAATACAGFLLAASPVALSACAAHRVELKGRVSEKGIRFSAQDDALVRGSSIEWIPKVVSTFGSDALGCSPPHPI